MSRNETIKTISAALLYFYFFISEIKFLIYDGGVENMSLDDSSIVVLNLRAMLALYVVPGLFILKLMERFNLLPWESTHIFELKIFQKSIIIVLAFIVIIEVILGINKM